MSSMAAGTAPRHPDLESWLEWLEHAHRRPIDLGLERVSQVARTMGLDHAHCPVITVGGTNGKGSTVAFLEAIYMAAGYRVGSYASPHLLRFNERIRLEGSPVDDGDICAAFQEIDRQRADVSLSYFEFATLAALWLFRRAQVDVMLLEVGLGGRLDAVNLLDPDVAVVTTVDLDHEHWLGEGREAIGREKAGIFRSGRPAVCGDANPPDSLVQHAANLSTPLFVAGRDFSHEVAEDGTGWNYRGPEGYLLRLPDPGLRGTIQRDNASTAITACRMLTDRLPVDSGIIAQGVLRAFIAGRLQHAGDRPLTLVDVAHNPHGARALAHYLREAPCAGLTHAVLGVMADKDADGIIKPLLPVIDAWFTGEVPVARAMSPDVLALRLSALGATRVVQLGSIVDAFEAARAQAAENDRIIVFGSFHTVAAVLASQTARLASTQAHP